MAAFSFFDGKEPPKLPSTPASTFGSFGNMSCFSFGLPKGGTSSSQDPKIFTFGFNPIKTSESNFDLKMEELRQSLSSINGQPLSVSIPNKLISERTKRIANLENTLNEIRSLKEKVSSVESSIAKLLLEELDSMKENVSGCVNQSLQIVEQKSVSTSPNLSIGFQSSTLVTAHPFPTAKAIRPVKGKPKQYSSFNSKHAELFLQGASSTPGTEAIHTSGASEAIFPSGFGVSSATGENDRVSTDSEEKPEESDETGT